MKSIFSRDSYVVKLLNGMAQGLFSSLIIGLILKQIGELTGLDSLVHMGEIAQFMMGPAIGAGVAHTLGAPPLGIFSSLIVGAIGAGTFQSGALAIGEPVGALLGSWFGAEVSKLVSGKTKMDIILVPSITIISGGLLGLFMAPYVSRMMQWIGSGINLATQTSPFPMGILLSTIMGMILTLPISSAAIAISLGLGGLAAGASTVGCATQMIGFAVMSFEVNGFGGLISQGIGTSMIQVPNIVRNPLIWIPPTLASAILGPVSTLIFKMENSAVGAGMVTSGLVGQFATMETMGSSGILGMILLHFILPAILTLLIYYPMKKRGLIKPEDLKLMT